MIGRVRIKCLSAVAIGVALLAVPGVVRAAPAPILQSQPVWAAAASGWTQQAGWPNSGFSGISCPTAQFCMAVGSDTGFWNGSTWTTTPLPAGPLGYPAILGTVSCPSSSWCLAAGHFADGSLAVQQWTPAAGWRVESAQAADPQNPGLAPWATAVSCSGIGQCEAVGYFRVSGRSFGDPLALRLNGGIWTQQTIPEVAGAVGEQLESVSCTSATFCQAVGEAGIATTSAASRVAALVWNGQSWVPETVSGAGNYASTSLGSVSCTATYFCMAAGDAWPPSGTESTALPYAAIWTGYGWNQVAIPSVAGPYFEIAGGVSCATTSFCQASGLAVPSSGPRIGLDYSWNGISWSTESPGSIDTNFVCMADYVCQSPGWIYHGPAPPPAGDAGFYGSMGGKRLNKPVVGMAATPDGKGYWLVASDGGIFSFGDARFYGSAGNLPLVEPIVGMAADRASGGYWFVASDGGVFAYNATFYGSMGGKRLNKPVVGMAATPDGKGYWLVASDGGVFPFGTARFYGSVGNLALPAPVVGIEPSGDSLGYWFVGADGQVFAY